MPDGKGELKGFGLPYPWLNPKTVRSGQDGRVKRRLLPVIAWIGATGLSIAVANAAVGSVRDQVSDAPNLSLATATATASVATAPSTSLVPTAIAPTSSTAPATTVGATSATPVTPTTTTAAVSTKGPAPTTSATAAVSTTSPAPTTTATPASEIKTYSVTGGTVSIEVFNDRIVLLGAVPASGWSVDEVEQSNKKIEIEFKADEDESKFKAKLEDGGQLSIETE